MQPAKPAAAFGADVLGNNKGRLGLVLPKVTCLVSCPRQVIPLPAFVGGYPLWLMTVLKLDRRSTMPRLRLEDNALCGTCCGAGR